MPCKRFKNGYVATGITTAIGANLLTSAYFKRHFKYKATRAVATLSLNIWQYKY